LKTDIYGKIRDDVATVLTEKRERICLIDANHRDKPELDAIRLATMHRVTGSFQKSDRFGCERFSAISIVEHIQWLDDKRCYFFKFKPYEDSSHSYTGIDKHEGGMCQ